MLHRSGAGLDLALAVAFGRRRLPPTDAQRVESCMGLITIAEARSRANQFAGRITRHCPRRPSISPSPKEKDSHGLRSARTALAPCYTLRRPSASTSSTSARRSGPKSPVSIGQRCPDTRNASCHDEPRKLGAAPERGGYRDGSGVTLARATKDVMGKKQDGHRACRVARRRIRRLGLAGRRLRCCPRRSDGGMRVQDRPEESLRESFMSGTTAFQRIRRIRPRTGAGLSRIYRASSASTGWRKS